MNPIRVLQALTAIPPMPVRRHCVMCGHRIGRFMSIRGGWRAVPPLMRALDVIGSDPDNFECPRCGSIDRERHLLMYLQAAGLLAWLKGKDVLHFAPEKRLARRIAACEPGRYVRCDLYPQSDDVIRVDMLAMQFAAGSFDGVIANHVLEHVADDLKALAEIKRVLRPGGMAILQTPFSRKLQRTWSDPGIDDAPARTQAYGQDDHVRLYGRDIFERFASVGLRSGVAQHAELLADCDPAEAGVNPSEPFFLFWNR